MTEVMKVIRWAVPGAIALLTSWLILLPLTRMGELALSPFPLDAGWFEKLSVVGMAAASVPVGFLIYQVYFYTHSKQRALVEYLNVDIGRRILEAADLDDLARTCTDSTPPCGHVGPRAYRISPDKQQRLRRWRELRPLLRPVALAIRPPFWLLRKLLRRTHPLWVFSPDLVPLKGDDATKALTCHYRHRAHNWMTVQGLAFARMDGIRVSAQLTQEVGRLAEIYHTLGASRLAILSGGAAVGTMILGAAVWGVVYSLIVSGSRLGVDIFLSALMLLLLCAYIALTFVVAEVLRKNRHETLIRYQNLLARVLLEGGSMRPLSRADSMPPFGHDSSTNL